MANTARPGMITFTAFPHDADALQAVAAREGISRSALLRRMVRAWLKTQEISNDQ